MGSIQGQTERSGNRTRSETRRTLGEGGGDAGEAGGGGGDYWKEDRFSLFLFEFLSYFQSGTRLSQGG